jgi:hypothetical protein
LLTTTTDWPNGFSADLAMARLIRSVLPPALEGAVSSIAFVG